MTVNSVSGTQGPEFYATGNASSVSTDQLLLMYQQASEANDTAQGVIKSRLQNAIDTKGAVGAVQADIQALSYDDNNISTGDGGAKLRADLESAIKNCSDPAIRAQLQKVHDAYFNNSDGAHSDNLLSRDEAGQLSKGLDAATSAVDDANNFNFMTLKTLEQKMGQVTDTMMSIQDAKNKNFERIMQQ